MKSSRIVVVLSAVALGAIGATAAGAVASEQTAYSPFDDVVFSAEIESTLSTLPADEYSGVQRTAWLIPILGAFEKLDGYVDGGFTTPTSEIVEVMWFGPKTDELAAALAWAETQGASLSVVTVDFTPALVKKAIRLVSIALDDAGISYDGIGPNRALSKLEITILGPDSEIDGAKAIIDALELGIPTTVAAIEYSFDGVEDGDDGAIDGMISTTY